MAFQNEPIILIIPVGADPTVGPVIVLNGEDGTITVIGIGGKKIVINPATVNPDIRWYSQDGSHFAYINQPATVAAHASIGVNSAAYVPADGTDRAQRMWLNSQGDQGVMEVVKDANQKRKGGFFAMRSDLAHWGYQDEDGSIVNYLQADKDTILVNIQGQSSFHLDMRDFNSGDTAQGPFIGVAMQDIVGLDNVPLKANADYNYHLQVYYDAAVATDAKFAWKISNAGVGMIRGINALDAGTASNITSNMTAIRRAATTQQTVGGPAGVANAFSVYYEFGEIRNTTASPQSIGLQVAEAVAGAGVTIQSRGMLEIRRKA